MDEEAPEDGGTAPRYRQPRVLIRWLANPYLRAAKMAAIIYFEQGLRGKKLGAAVRRLFPDIDEEAGMAVPDKTIGQRGVMGCSIRSEHYSAKPELTALADRVREHIASGESWPRPPWPSGVSDEIPF